MSAQNLILVKDFLDSQVDRKSATKTHEMAGILYVLHRSSGTVNVHLLDDRVAVFSYLEGTETEPSCEEVYVYNYHDLMIVLNRGNVFKD